MAQLPLGRRTPEDWEHYDKFPLRLEATAEKAEKTLTFYPTWRVFYDQGREGACVGFSCSQMMSVLNRKRYDARWLWNRAKEIDEWSDTNPGDDNGTSVRAALDILRDRGHCRVLRGKTLAADSREGVLENRWANKVDELRTLIVRGIPVVLGTNWYEVFDRPEKVNGEYWLAKQGAINLGNVRGGHAYMLQAVSDRRQAFFTPNNWGADWPATGFKGAWIPFNVVQRLINEDGEATLVSDRP